MKQWSLDARSEGQPRPPRFKKHNFQAAREGVRVLVQRAVSEDPRLGCWHVSACQWVGGWERGAQWETI